MCEYTDLCRRDLYTWDFWNSLPSSLHREMEVTLHSQRSMLLNLTDWAFKVTDGQCNKHHEKTQAE